MEKIRARIAVSSAARRTVVEHFGGDAVLIPNGVDVAAFRGASPLPGHVPNGATLGFLGRFDEPRKGFAVLLDAFALHGRASGPTCGCWWPVPATSRTSWTTCRPSLAARVDFLGMVSDADKVRFFRSIDVYVAPNVGQESFGVILLEAAAAGSADRGQRPRRVHPGARRRCRGGAVRDRRRAALAASLATGCSTRPSVRAELRAGGDVVAGRYDWDSVARQVLEVYETVTAGALATVGEDEASEGLLSRLMSRG